MSSSPDTCIAIIIKKKANPTIIFLLYISSQNVLSVSTAAIWMRRKTKQPRSEGNFLNVI